jgi:hypothetical protein
MDSVKVGSNVRFAALMLPFAAAACGEPELPGHLFEVTVEARTDGCNEPDVSYAETFTYRLVLEDSRATVYIGESTLATGALTGCDLSYASTVWTDTRPEGTVRWSIIGEATVSLGDGCDAGDGWVGDETLRVNASTVDDIDQGCVMELDASGTYLGENP